MSKDSEIENERLGREWMASEHWGGWRVGMVCDYGRACVSLGADGVPWFTWGSGTSRGDRFAWLAPDLNHPGTRAFLLEDVRRAWDDEGIGNKRFIDRDGGNGWRVEPSHGATIAVTECGGTEQAALIAALRAAPEIETLRRLRGC